MPNPLSFRRAMLVLASVVILSPPLLAETYIIPLWARALGASDGEWWTQAVIANPNSFPVVVDVAGAFPLATTECSTCTDVAHQRVQAVFSLADTATRAERPPM